MTDRPAINSRPVSPTTLGPPTLCLASQSPRRLRLLSENGFEVTPVSSGVDDSRLTMGEITPEHWTVALAYLKAFAASILLMEHPGRANRVKHPLVLGADTVVEYAGEVIGQPRDEMDARAILHRLNDAPHRVITGVALIDPMARRRVLFVDAAEVEVGRIDDREIEDYLKSGTWRGKAGAYNLSERLDAGWPITYQGDPTSIMGLPMKRLTRCLEQGFGILPV